MQQLQIISQREDLEMKKTKDKASFADMRWLFTTGLLLMLCLQGCSSAQSPPFPEFETVSIHPLRNASESVKATTGRNPEKDGFLYGGAAGGGTALVASAACGPLFMFCAMVFVPAAAAVGGTSGLIVGTLINDDLQAVFGEKGGELEPILAGLKERRDISGEILRTVSTEIPADRQADPDQASALISVGPRSIDLVLVNEAELAVRMTGELVARYNLQRVGSESYRRRSYVHQTEAFAIEHWLSNSGANLDQAYTECVEEITTGVIADLNL
jgi:hypothetical protein